MASPRRTDVQAIVFAAHHADRYKAGRTVRALERAGVPVTSCINGNLAQTLSAATTAVWLLAAGTWPAQSEPLDFPPASQTGRPLCALGMARAPADSSPAPLAHPEWDHALAHTGGDFENSSAHPRLVSVYLEPALAAELATRLRGGEFNETLWTMLDSTLARVVRWPDLDVHDDPRLRIAEVITSLQRGGAERMVLDLTESLTKCGVMARIITTGRPTRDAFVPPKDTIDVSPAPGGSLGRIKAAVDAALSLNADLVHAHLLDGPALKCFREASLPLMLTVHNMRSGWQADPAHFDGDDVSLLAACSRRVEQDVRETGYKEPVRTAWNGIDFTPHARTPQLSQAAAALRRKWDLFDDDDALVALANPRPQKRLERLPAIIALMKERYAAQGSRSKLRLFIAGEPSSARPEALESECLLRAEIARCNVEKEVICLGNVRDVPELLAACNAFVSVSAWEGLSLAMLEALAAGIHVIATDVGGTAEVAHQNPAVRLLPAEFYSAEAADALIERLRGPFFNGRTAAQHNFSREQMAERYARLARRAIERPQRARGNGVWLITNNFSTGGAQSSARRLLVGMHASGTRVRAAVIQEQPENPTPGRRALEAHGIPVRVVTPLGVVDPADAVEELLAEIDADPPEAILMWNLVAQYKVLLADLLLDTPLFDVSPGEMNFASLQRYFESPRPALPYRTSQEYGARLAGAIVKYEAERQLAEQRFGIAVSVIPNGVPAPTEFPRRSTTGRLVIGTVARLSPQKKLEQLFDALRKIHTRMPPYTLRIAGGVDGNDHAYVAKLKDSARDLTIEWVGEVDPIDGFLAQLDLFVMISEPAGCPNASLEAMAAGLPVIATDFGGASEQIVDGQTGRLTPRGDVDALSAAILDAAADRERLITWGENAWQRVRSNFSLEEMVAKYKQALGIHKP